MNTPRLMRVVKPKGTIKRTESWRCGCQSVTMSFELAYDEKVEHSCRRPYEATGNWRIVPKIDPIEKIVKRLVEDVAVLTLEVERLKFTTKHDNPFINISEGVMVGTVPQVHNLPRPVLDAQQWGEQPEQPQEQQPEPVKENVDSLPSMYAHQMSVKDCEFLAECLVTLSKLNASYMGCRFRNKAWEVYINRATYRNTGLLPALVQALNANEHLKP